MADDVKVESLGDALALLGKSVTFHEEAEAIAFGDFVSGLQAEAAAEAGDDLAELTKAELLELAEEQGADVSASSTKAEILEALQADEEEEGS